MIPPPPRSKLTYTLFPFTTLFRSRQAALLHAVRGQGLHRAARRGVAGCVRPQYAAAGAPRVLRTAQRAVQREALLRQAEFPGRSEEHTSELQSLMRISYAVFCLKKKKKLYMYKYSIFHMINI